MNKSSLTNLIAAAIFIASYLSPEFTGREHLIQASLFAFSGAITNWLAVHMLFEKVPGFYGSGIIPNNFEKFKKGIRDLIMDNFFTKENIEKYVNTSIKDKIDMDKLLNKVFDELVKVVQQSPLGGMLGMFGGEAVIEKLREPFLERIAQVIEESNLVQKFTGGETFDKMQEKVAELIDGKLEELTPQMVKDIVQKMIREHLGWLVVWGGVFGAAIGLICSFSLT